MGLYINPPELVLEIGKPIEGNSFDELRQQLGPDENLFGSWFRLDRGFYNVPWLRDESEYDQFVVQQLEGRLLLNGYYAVPEDDFPTRASV